MVGLGAVALDGLVALVVTGALLRDRIGARTFRAIHWAAYAAWPVAFVHALGIGSDTGDAVAARPRARLRRRRSAQPSPGGRAPSSPAPEGSR